MTDRPGFCENRDGIICDGVNGLKSIVQGFGGDNGRTSAPPTSTSPPPELVTSTPDEASEATPPPPPPPPPPPVIITSTSPPEIVTVSVTPPASTPTPVIPPPPPPPPPEMASPPPQEPTTSSFPQLILPTPVMLTSTSSRGSFIESLPTRTATLNPVNNPLVPSIFASTDFNSPIIGPATTVTSIPTETVIATPGAPPQGAISDRSTQFPAALVVGVSGGVIAFIFAFAMLWRYYLRRQSQRRQAQSVADEKGLAKNHDHDNPQGPFERPADRIVTTEIWTGSPPSKSEQTRFSWAATEVSLGADLEPLSPKPVIQQTVHRVSVPKPVEASSFRSGSNQGSLRGSLSRPPSTSQQATAREAAATQGTESKHRSSTRLQVPGTEHRPQTNDLATQPEETDGEPEPDLSDLELVPATLETSNDEGPGLKRQYTLRSSPLHQNPFRDPVEEDAPTETPMSVTFEIVTPDTSPPRSTSGSGSEAQGVDRHEGSGSPIHVLQTITLSAEDLKRASTAKTIV